MPAIVIAVMVAIPVMVVIEAAMRTIPVAGVEPAAFMARTDPMRAGVRWTSPISFMPNVTAACGIPVALYPNEFGTRANRDDVVPRRWWRPDLDSDRDLGVCMISAKQEH